MKDETHFWSEDVVDAMCRVGTGTEGQEAVPAVCYFVLFKGGAMAGLKSRTMLIGFDWESSLREDEAVNKPVNSWIHCEHDVTLLNEGIIQINAPSALVFGYITPVASLFFKLPLGEMFPQEEFNYHSLRNLVPTWWIFMLSGARPLSLPRWDHTWLLVTMQRRSIAVVRVTDCFLAGTPWFAWH